MPSDLPENQRQTGVYQKLGELEFFLPFPLPPKNPAFDFDVELIELYGEAMQALGALNEMSDRVPSVERFVKVYCLKEALLSSAIEGIHTTMLDVFTNEVSANQTISKQSKQTQLVLNYGRALEAALDLVQKQNFPIVSRVILSAHKTLMSGGGGEKASPGQYRKQQVKVGKLTPPPANKVAGLISDLEKFINNDNSLPALIKAGLAHVQFETIHPFLDGNGRIGRLLIVLMLVQEKVIHAPIIYPSTYFKKHRAKYYEKLDSVRSKGDFEGWIKFYLEAIKESGIDACKRAQAIEKLEKQLSKKITSSKNFSLPETQANQALAALFQFPVISITELQNALNVSYNTANSIIQKLIKLEILKLETKQKRNKLFRFDGYLDLLEK
ncbi:MAG: Fic family protein [Alphaproteobacteria bacterium]|nr:Fic family protein [Alphaproteobacteria bacterium]